MTVEQIKEAIVFVQGKIAEATTPKPALPEPTPTMGQIATRFDSQHHQLKTAMYKVGDLMREMRHDVANSVSSVCVGSFDHDRLDIIRSAMSSAESAYELYLASAANIEHSYRVVGKLNRLRA